MNIKEQIESKIKNHLSPVFVEVIDESPNHGREGQSSHFRVLVVSSAFEGLSSVQRHQKVFQSVGSEIIGQIHAFSQQTYTPEEWKQSGVLREAPPCHHKR